MEEIINIVMNYGIGVACIMYFMYFSNTTLKQLTETITKINENLILMNERIEKIENTLYRKKGEDL